VCRRCPLCLGLYGQCHPSTVLLPLQKQRWAPPPLTSLVGEPMTRQERATPDTGRKTEGTDLGASSYGWWAHRTPVGPTEDKTDKTCTVLHAPHIVGGAFPPKVVHVNHHRIGIKGKQPPPPRGMAPRS
jgi:hypothetical protein